MPFWKKRKSSLTQPNIVIYNQQQCDVVRSTVEEYFNHKPGTIGRRSNTKHAAIRDFKVRNYLGEEKYIHNQDKEIITKKVREFTNDNGAFADCFLNWGGQATQCQITEEVFSHLSFKGENFKGLKKLTPAYYFKTNDNKILAYFFELDFTLLATYASQPSYKLDNKSSRAISSDITDNQFYNIMSIVEKDKELDSTLINILSPNQKPISLLAAMKKVEKACQNAIAKQTANPNLPTKPLAMSDMLLEISKNPKNEKDKPANVKVVDFILAKNTPDIMFNSLFLKLNSESISIDDLNQDFRERLMKGDQKDHKAFQQYLQKYSSGNTEIANSFSLINENIKKFSTKLTESFNTMISKNQDLQTENETETSSLKMKREIYADSRKLLLLSRKRLNEFNESIKYNLSNHYKTRAALHQEMMKFAGYLGTGKLGTFYRTLKPEQPLKIGEINSTNELAKMHETANIEANIYLLKLDNIICDLESKSKQLEEIQKMQAMIKRLAKKFSMYEANSHTLASHSYWHTTHIPKQVHTGIGHSSQPIEADLAGKPIIETIMEKGCILNKDNQLQKLESPEAVTQAIEKKQSIHLYDNVDNKGIYYGSLKTDGKGGIIGSNFNPRLANIASVDDPYFHEKIADWLRPALKSAIETAYQSDDKEVVIQCGKSKLGVQIYQIAVEIANAVIKEDDDITLVTDNNKIKKEINSLSEKFKLPSRSKLPSKSTYDYKPLIEELIAHKKQQIPNLFKDLEKELQEAQASRAKTSFKV